MQQPQEVRPRAAAATPANAMSLISFFIVVCGLRVRKFRGALPPPQDKSEPGATIRGPGLAGKSNRDYLVSIGIGGAGAGGGGPGSDAHDDRAKAPTMAAIETSLASFICFGSGSRIVSRRRLES